MFCPGRYSLNRAVVGGRESGLQGFQVMMSFCLRRIVVFLSIVLIGFAVCEASDERPHIVLVMADDQGWGDMGYNGHPVIQTPNFDEAAASGLRFDRFYAAAPVCSPTRASVLTGRHPNRTAVFSWGHPIRPQEETIAEVLQANGYRTGHFGKWHLGSVRRDSPVNPGRNGFERWFSAPNFYDNNPIMCNEGVAVKTQGESSDITVDAAIEWIEESLPGDAPLFAVIWFGSPHSPHHAAKEDKELYSDQPEKAQDFYGEITGMDRAFGKLRNSLTELGIRENTVLWYCSDNGALPKVGSAGGRRGVKGDVYEGGLLVPAILEWPAKIAEARETDFRANTSDIFPTILEITAANRSSDAPLDGISLLPLIEGSMSERPTGMGFWSFPAPGIGVPSDDLMAELFAAQKKGKDLPPGEVSLKAAKMPMMERRAENFRGHSAWLEGDWKLHRIKQRKQVKVHWELYNLANDPNETRNLAKSEPERAQAYRERLESWLESVTESLHGADYLNSGY